MKKNFAVGFQVILVAVIFLLSAGEGLSDDTTWGQNIDKRSGMTWATLVKGDLPEDHFWDYINPQREYLRKTYGDDISTTYQLFCKEKERLETENPVKDDHPILEMKTLKRWPDPVIFQGKDMPEWIGNNFDDLRLYACHLGRFVPIPYQFDELTEKGKKVLPDGGPEANPEDGNSLLDPQDDFLFMAHDLGDRVSPGQWLQGFDQALEITVKDPKDGGKGWCYLVSFNGNPPAPSPLNYATFKEDYNQSYGFYLFEQGQFKRSGDNLYRQIFNQKWKLPDYAGGNFTNFIDRLKFRVRVRLFFGTLKLTTGEDDASGDTLAVRDGPVRCVRRCWGQVRLPMGLKTPKIVSDIIGYDTLFVCPVKLSVPINPGLVLTDLSLYSGTDLNSRALGSHWYNSNNLAGFDVDGKTTDDEKNIDTTVDQWRLVTGAWGTMMNRSLWDPHFREQAKIRIQFTDDVNLEDPPEYFPGQIGMAYNFSTVRSLKPGTYEMELDWYFVPHFNTPEQTGSLNMESVQAHLDMYDNLLEISTGQGWFANDPRPKGP